MEYRRLGKAGVQVSALSLGSWVTFGNQIGDDVAEACMIAAYEAGVNFFDNAEAYAGGRSEEVMGRLLKKFGWRRDSFLVSSKVFFGPPPRGPNQRGLSRKHIMEACEAALQRLQVDYLDLYYCHRPDPETPILESVRAMNTLIAQGKVFYWGTSEWSAQQIQEACTCAERYGLIGPTMEQPQYNLFTRRRVEEEYAPLYASEHGLGTTIWSPLASGLLTGKYLNGIPEGSRLTVENFAWLREEMMSELGKEKVIAQINALNTLALELETNLPRLAIAWCAKNPHVSTVITGASRVEQVQDNMQALEVLPRLTEAVMARIDAILAA